MSSELTTAASPPRDRLDEEPARPPALVIAWSAHEPARTGEVAFLDPGRDWILGRSGNLRWQRHRPATRHPTDELSDPSLSREQLKLRAGARGEVELEAVGRLPVRVNGLPVDRRAVDDGDLVEIGDRLVLLVQRRPRELEGERPTHPFGEADAQGIVGEGPEAWRFRSQLAFLARRPAHVLVRGESGTGKELAARALHALSPRARGPLVSRSAATIPESLADAELFGNLGNYPNPGMAARAGLVGEADGGTLFLDEFGELPLEIQARLLRVLDAGEYTRLGEARPRRSDLRLVAATNRPADALKHDVLARLPLRLEIAPLSARREDVPLLAVHLLRAIAREDAEVARDWFVDGWPRLAPRLVAALVQHPYRTHVRELLALLWRSIGESRDSELDLVAGHAELLVRPAPASVGDVDPSTLSPELIQACLDRHGGRQELAWRDLGLASRHVLARLVKRYGLRVRGRGQSGE